MPVGRGRVLAVAVHPSAVASTRLRVEQYRDALASRGLDLTMWTFFRAADLPAWEGGSTLARVGCVLRSLGRLPALVRAARGADVLLVQQEALPFGPAWVERLIRGRRRRPLVWDIDDSVWEHHVSVSWVPQWLRATGDKYRRLCETADEVWAGSEVLARWCREHNSNVVVVPTVVDVPEHLPAAAPGRVAGWIGSRTTAPFLETVLPAVAAVKPPPEVVAVGGEPAAPGDLRVTVERWSPATEAAALARMRVGLYPIERDHPLAEGKCGLKAILYMAHGIPPVVTPTATNATIVRDALDGLHADSPEEWTAAVATILDDARTWQRLRTSAHHRVRTHYSLGVWGPTVAARLHDLAGHARTRRVTYLTVNSLADGVGASQVLPYVERIAAAGRPVTLHTFEREPRAPSTEARLAAVGVHWVPHQFGRGGAAGGLVRVVRGAAAIRRAELVHARGYLPAGAAMLMGRPFVWDMRAFFVDQRIASGSLSPTSVVARALRRLEGAAALRARGVVVLAAAAVQILAERYGGVVAAKCAVVPTCVDLDRFRPHPMPSAPVQLLMAGTLNPLYDRATMAAFAEEAGAVLRVVQHTPPEEMPAEIADAHAGLCMLRGGHPVSSAGAVPTKLAEFLAVGRPVVVSAGLGDMDDLVARHRCGVVVASPDEHDIRAAANELRELLAEPGMPDRCRAAAAAHFDLDAGVAALLALYDSLDDRLK